MDQVEVKWICNIAALIYMYACNELDIVILYAFQSLSPVKISPYLVSGGQSGGAGAYVRAPEYCVPAIKQTCHGYRSGLASSSV